jgi:hypothetical protein
VSTVKSTQRLAWCEIVAVWLWQPRLRAGARYLRPGKPASDRTRGKRFRPMRVTIALPEASRAYV